MTAAVLEDHGDLAGIAGDMIVGHDVAAGVNNEPRAQANDFMLLAPHATVPEPFQQVVERRGLVAFLGRLGAARRDLAADLRGNSHHGGRHASTSGARLGSGMVISLCTCAVTFCPPGCAPGAGVCASASADASSSATTAPPINVDRAEVREESGS